MCNWGEFWPNFPSIIVRMHAVDFSANHIIRFYGRLQFYRIEEWGSAILKSVIAFLRTEKWFNQWMQQYFWPIDARIVLGRNKIPHRKCEKRKYCRLTHLNDSCMPCGLCTFVLAEREQRKNKTQINSVQSHTHTPDWNYEIQTVSSTHICPFAARRYV